MSRQRMAQQFQCDNIEVLQKLYAQQRHVILLLGHMGNWEWLLRRLAYLSDYELAVVYKPLKNKYLDQLIFYLRTSFGAKLIFGKLIKQNDTFKAMHQYNAHTQTLTALISDQAPTSPNVYTTSLLNQPTRFFKGPEKIARKLNHAVVYGHTRRMRRGYYTIHLDLIAENPADTKENEITELYIKKLEKNIQQQPAIWLCSYQRWKNRTV